MPNLYFEPPAWAGLGSPAIVIEYQRGASPNRWYSARIEQVRTPYVVASYSGLDPYTGYTQVHSAQFGLTEYAVQDNGARLRGRGKSDSLHLVEPNEENRRKFGNWQRWAALNAHLNRIESGLERARNELGILEPHHFGNLDEDDVTATMVDELHALARRATEAARIGARGYLPDISTVTPPVPLD